LTPVARSLRGNATSAERRLWQGLRRGQLAGFRFRRQVILGGFIVDFASLDARLIVAGATHSTDNEIARDVARSDVLTAQGFAILRFTNDYVFHNLSGVLETIWAKLVELRPRIEEDPDQPDQRDPPP
jgi:very-short-patch-repair endonuclease